MEIEKKFLVNEIPFSLDSFKSRKIEQAYLSTDPVIRVRRDNDEYYLTYKSKGFIVREEYNLPLNKSSYEHLLSKADGNIITKTRYEIPEKNNLTIELVIFEGKFTGLILAEVEFESEADANSYIPPEWFTKDVSNESAYHNSTLSQS